MKGCLRNKSKRDSYHINFYKILLLLYNTSDLQNWNKNVWIQNINEYLYRETSFGTLQPVTGAFITADNAKYLYTGFQIPKKNGSFTFTPSFTPGLYDEGDGKDLGHVIEFKTEIQISYEISNESEIGLSYNHISNASLGDKNPGANSYMFNFIKIY